MLIALHSVRVVGNSNSANYTFIYPKLDKYMTMTNKSIRDYINLIEGLSNDGIKLSHDMSPDMLYVHASKDGTDVGGARFKNIDGVWTGDIVHVYPQFRRQGVATKIYDYAENLVGKIVPSTTLKPKGKKFWANRISRGAEDQIEEASPESIAKIDQITRR